MPQERLGNSKPAFFEADTRGRARGSANVRFRPIAGISLGRPIAGLPYSDDQLATDVRLSKYAAQNGDYANAPAPRAIKPNESGRLPVGVMRFLQLRTPG